MNRISFLLVGLLVSPLTLAVESVPADYFDAYGLKLNTATKVEGYTAEQFLGSVQQPKSLWFKVHLPIEVQQFNLLISNGQSVVENERIAQLTGHDVELFIDDLKSKKQLLSLAAKQYKSHKELYNSGSIDIGTWQTVSQDYLTKEYAYKKLSHIDEVLEYEQEKVFLLAPRKGHFVADEMNAHNEEIAIAISPVSWVLIKAPIDSFKINDTLSDSTNGKCQFSVQRIEKNSNGLDARVWAKQILDNCMYDYYQLLRLAKTNTTQHYQVPSVAIALLNESESIFVKRGDQIVAVPVVTKSISSDMYIFSSDELKVTDQVVVSSVGAVKGAFLELGTN